MKKTSDVPRVFPVFVSISLTVILCGVFAVEAKQTNLKKNGYQVLKTPVPSESPVMPKSSRNPQINQHGDVVWEGYDEHDWEIFLYSKGKIIQITDNDYDDRNPQINSKGQIVWEGYDGNDWEIFLYSGGKITQITDNEYDDRNPRINPKGEIVWHGFDGRDDQVFLYSKGTITQMTDSEYHDPNAEINAKEQIVWEGSDGHDLEIFLYSNGTITQITDNEYDDYSPRINSKGQIVWHGFDGHDDQIFLYSEGTTTKITNVPMATGPLTGWTPSVGYFQTGSAVFSSPAIDLDGTIYVSSADNNLYAINPDGTQKWAFLWISAIY